MLKQVREITDAKELAEFLKERVSAYRSIRIIIVSPASDKIFIEAAYILLAFRQRKNKKEFDEGWYNLEEGYKKFVSEKTDDLLSDIRKVVYRSRRALE